MLDRCARAITEQDSQRPEPLCIIEEASAVVELLRLADKTLSIDQDKPANALRKAIYYMVEGRRLATAP
jgi:hypothetical protein